MVKSMVGAAAGWGGLFAKSLHWLDPWIRAISFYGGAILVVASIISVSIDIYRKWKGRNRPDEP